MKHIKLNPLITENINQDGEGDKVWSKEELKKLDIFGNEQKARYMLSKHPLSETCDLYFFIARPTFEEIEKDGDTLYKKGWDIENMVKLDKENPNFNTLKMMKMRAQMQGDDSKLYQIWINIGIFDDQTYGSDIDPETTKIIMSKAKTI